MTQFQVHKHDLSRTRFVELDVAAMTPKDGEVLVRIERFGFSANNFTYAVAGETLGYWQFFPAAGDDSDEWGVVPVWGFAEIVASNVAELAVGERLFGYFPPASHLVMQPERVSETTLLDASEHRSKLPRGYNTYQRVEAEPGYNRAHDDLRMLFLPLYITSFAIWDQLKEHDWYGAEQVILVSASSKTSIGLAQALADDRDAPRIVGLTSQGNMDFVNGLGLYDEVIGYDTLEDLSVERPSAIVDMSGNAALLGRLHKHLGDAMRHMLDVGLTHWDGARKDADIIRDRREFFFAPARIQKRMKDWGAGEFNRRALGFVMASAAKTAGWLEMEQLSGLHDLEPVFHAVREGRLPPQKGITIVASG